MALTARRYNWEQAELGATKQDESGVPILKKEMADMRSSYGVERTINTTPRL
jgi:hypothetical protein